MKWARQPLNLPEPSSLTVLAYLGILSDAHLPGPQVTGTLLCIQLNLLNHVPVSIKLITSVAVSSVSRQLSFSILSDRARLLQCFRTNAIPKGLHSCFFSHRRSIRGYSPEFSLVQHGRSDLLRLCCILASRPDGVAVQMKDKG